MTPASPLTPGFKARQFFGEISPNEDSRGSPRQLNFESGDLLFQGEGLLELGQGQGWRIRHGVNVEEGGGVVNSGGKWEIVRRGSSRSLFVPAGIGFLGRFALHFRLLFKGWNPRG